MTQSGGALLGPESVRPLGQPSDEEWHVLWRLVERLRELGYTEEGVSRCMGISDHSTRNLHAWPAHVRNCRKHKAENPCALLAAFFLAEESVQESELSEVLGVECVKLMRRLKLIGKLGGKLHFRYFLYPLLGSYLLTDGYVSNPNHANQVYMLGSDSHTLARLAPRPRAAKALDHCTGSGVHAVLAGTHVERSLGLDINPRALDVSRFNAKLNRLETAHFLESDCYTNVTQAGLGWEEPFRFDLITANPPFVPTPETLSLCRGGGLSGEDVTEKIVRGLPGRLSSDGIFSMATNVPIFRDQTFFGRCEEWLGSSSGWGMIDLATHRWTVPSYVMGQMQPGPGESYGDAFDRWLAGYESVGLESLTNSMVYLFPSSHPWRIERPVLYPSQAQSEFIERWIASLTSLAPETVYRLHPDLEKVVWAEGRERVFLEWSERQRWWQPIGAWLEAGPALRAVAALYEHPEGLPASALDRKGLPALLESHLVTRVEGS